MIISNDKISIYFFLIQVITCLSCHTYLCQPRNGQNYLSDCGWLLNYQSINQLVSFVSFPFPLHKVLPPGYRGMEGYLSCSWPCPGWNCSFDFALHYPFHFITQVIYNRVSFSKSQFGCLSFASGFLRHMLHVFLFSHEIFPPGRTGWGRATLYISTETALWFPLERKGQWSL